MGRLGAQSNMSDSRNIVPDMDEPTLSLLRMLFRR